ncbi:MAG: hypothetical protein HYR72_13080 [Deltaproteobacteria bacterium]|nr:hypothetical protein [Deltaproteobacteria bacterium]MBI3390491.1 hypothetical protein [Deltaproteobacteria bacterium]
MVEPSGATEDHSSQQSDSERARLAVTKRVKAAIGNITEYHPILGYHLGVTIRTGARCAYHPDPERQVSWATSATTSTRNEGG